MNVPVVSALSQPSELLKNGDLIYVKPSQQENDPIDEGLYIYLDNNWVLLFERSVVRTIDINQSTLNIVNTLAESLEELTGAVDELADSIIQVEETVDDLTTCMFEEDEDEEDGILFGRAIECIINCPQTVKAEQCFKVKMTFTNKLLTDVIRGELLMEYKGSDVIKGFTVKKGKNEIEIEIEAPSKTGKYSLYAACFNDDFDLTHNVPTIEVIANE